MHKYIIEFARKLVGSTKTIRLRKNNSPYHHENMPI